MTGPRPADTLWLDAAGGLHGHVPPGPHVYPADPADVLALDAAVRAATTAHRVVPGPPGAPRWAGDLERFIRRRLPAVLAALTADGTLAATTAARAAQKAAALEALGAPAAVVDPVRRHARAAATPGWRPDIDPAPLVPDPAEVAAAVDVDRWPSHPPFVTADIAGLVLLAALCTIGPTTAAVHADETALRWRPLGGGTPPDPGPAPHGAVVVGLSVYDDTVERLEYALHPGGALLAVALA